MDTSAEFHPYAASAALVKLLVRDDDRTVNSLLDGYDPAQLSELARASLQLLIWGAVSFCAQLDHLLMHLAEGDDYTWANGLVMNSCRYSAELEFMRQSWISAARGSSSVETKQQRTIEAFDKFVGHQLTEGGRGDDGNCLGED